MTRPPRSPATRVKATKCPSPRFLPRAGTFMFWSLNMQQPGSNDISGASQELTLDTSLSPHYTPSREPLPQT
jgi:hypothetical protein